MQLPKRKPTRLHNYNYSRDGYYFITICTYERKCILSNIVGEGEPLPQLTQNGKIAENYILSINEKYSCAEIDKYIIMPNHLHIILRLKNNGRGTPSPTISNIIGWMKYNITKEINQANNTQGNTIFQRSFHDHIIRNEKDYLKIWNYVDANAQKWKEDCFYNGYRKSK